MATLDLLEWQKKRLQQNSLGAVVIKEIAGRGRCCVAQWYRRVLIMYARHLRLHVLIHAPYSGSLA